MDEGTLKNPPSGTADEFLARAIRFCEYRERCTLELRRKLDGWQLTASSRDTILEQLIDLGYLNDERFAESYAGSKFRVSRWGKVKIRAELRARQINDDVIEKVLSRIGPEKYQEELESLLNSKKRSLSKYKGHELRGRLFRYAASKGYESGCILQVLNRILID